MPANTAPIYSIVPATTIGGTVATGNTDKTAASGTVVIVFTAGTNGSWIEKLIWQPLGTNVVTVGRLFLNNGAATTTPANNSYMRDITLPATTVSEVASMVAQEMALNFAIAPGYRLVCTVGTTVAAGFAVTVVAGSY